MVKNIFISLQKLEVSWPSLKAVIETFKNLDKRKRGRKWKYFTF